MQGVLEQNCIEMQNSEPNGKPLASTSAPKSAIAIPSSAGKTKAKHAKQGGGIADTLARLRRRRPGAGALPPPTEDSTDPFEEEEDEGNEMPERIQEPETKRLRWSEPPQAPSKTPQTPEEARAAVIAQVEEMRKRHPTIRQAWREYCLSFGTKTEDPTRHQSGFIQKFVITMAPTLMSLPDFTPGPAPDANTDPEYIQLLGRIKNFQKFSKIQSDQWEKYCETSYGGIRDPARHGKESLLLFTQMYNIA